MIGNIVGKTYVKRDKETSLLRIGGGSWTILLDEIEGEEISKIRFITDAVVYDITLEEAYAFGFERDLGGERKLVVPVKHWELHERGTERGLA